VEQAGTPLELYHHPANLFVAGFIGSPKMNFLETTVSALEGTGATVALPGGGQVTVPVQPGRLTPGDSVTLGVRPEHLRPADAGELSGEVLVVERLGGETFLYAQLPDQSMITIQADGALVVPENRRTDWTTVWPEDNRAVHLPGQPDRIGRRDPIQKRPARNQQGLPPDVGVLFRPSRQGSVQRIGLPRRPKDPPGLVDQHRLQTRRPEVEPDHVQQTSASRTALHRPTRYHICLLHWRAKQRCASPDGAPLAAIDARERIASQSTQGRWRKRTAPRSAQRQRVIWSPVQNLLRNARCEQRQTQDPPTRASAAAVRSGAKPSLAPLLHPDPKIIPPRSVLAPQQEDRVVGHVHAAAFGVAAFRELAVVHRGRGH
jgi:MalK OB fold domain